MKKYRGLVLLSILAAMLLASVASPAFASTKHTEAIVTSTQVANGDQWKPGGSSLREVNQSFSGRAFSGNSTTFKGRYQANPGNSGTNKGFNQNNNANAGNQFIHMRETNGPLRINQFNNGTIYSDSSTLTIGDHQTNTGNSGFNVGFNQDNGGNAGNQIID